MIRYLRTGRHETARPALFLDRDGVLNRRKVNGYVVRASELELLELALGAARLARLAGAALVVITNQGCIGRGLATEVDVMKVHAALMAELAERDVTIDAIYACPHHPLADDPKQRNCTCRKPKPGMIVAAANDLNLDLRLSVFVGDQESDIAAALAAGIAVDRALSVEHHEMAELETAIRTAF